MAHLIAGLPAFLGFIPLTWASLVGHLLFALVLAWVVRWRERGTRLARCIWSGDGGARHRHDRRAAALSPNHRRSVHILVARRNGPVMSRWWDRGRCCATSRFDDAGAELRRARGQPAQAGGDPDGRAPERPAAGRADLPRGQARAGPGQQCLGGGGARAERPCRLRRRGGWRPCRAPGRWSSSPTIRSAWSTGWCSAISSRWCATSSRWWR